MADEEADELVDDAEGEDEAEEAVDDDDEEDDDADGDVVDSVDLFGLTGYRRLSVINAINNMTDKAEVRTIIEMIRSKFRWPK